MSFLTIRGCILGIKKEAPQKTWRFLNSASVGAGFLLSRTAVSFTVEDSSMNPAPVQIRATPSPGNITTRNKILSKNYPVAFQMLGLLMTLVNTFRYRPLDIYCQFVGDGAQYYRQVGFLRRALGLFGSSKLGSFCGTRSITWTTLAVGGP